MVNWLTTEPLVLNSSHKLLPAESSELRFCSLFKKKKEEGEEQVLEDKNRIGLAREIFLIIIQELEEN